MWEGGWEMSASFSAHAGIFSLAITMESYYLKTSEQVGMSLEKAAACRHEAACETCLGLVMEVSWDRLPACILF